MGQLVLLVVAAAWAAVLLPPLLRSRLENRPNSSVTDFRRQLNRLQSSVPQRAGGSMRYSMARPLAPSPLQRPAAGGRPGTPHARRNAAAHRQRRAARPRRRSERAARGFDAAPHARRGPAPGPPSGLRVTGRRRRRRPAPAFQRVVHAGAGRGQHAVPRRHHRGDGDAVPVRAVVPGARRLHLPAGPAAPT